MALRLLSVFLVFGGISTWINEINAYWTSSVSVCVSLGFAMCIELFLAGSDAFIFWTTCGLFVLSLLQHKYFADKLNGECGNVAFLALTFYLIVACVVQHRRTHGATLVACIFVAACGIIAALPTSDAPFPVLFCAASDTGLLDLQVLSAVVGTVPVLCFWFLRLGGNDVENVEKPDAGEQKDERGANTAPGEETGAKRVEDSSKRVDDSANRARQARCGLVFAIWSICYIICIANYYEIRKFMHTYGEDWEHTLVTTHAELCESVEHFDDHETILYDSMARVDNVTATQREHSCVYKYHESTQNAVLLALVVWCFFALVYLEPEHKGEKVVQKSEPGASADSAAIKKKPTNGLFSSSSNLHAFGRDTDHELLPLVF